MAPRARKATETPSGAEPATETQAEVPTPPDEDENLEEYEKRRAELIEKLDAVIKDRGSVPDTIVGKLAMITGVIGQVRKTGRNTFHNYAYAKESDLVEAIRPLLARMGIWVWWSLAQEPEKGIIAHQRLSQIQRKNGQIIGEAETLTVTTAWFQFVDEDGNETKPQLMMGYGDDNGDKGLYKAYTGMEKYFLFKTFLVSTGDDPEGDARTDRRAEAREAGSGPNVNVQGGSRRPQQGQAPQVTRGHQGGNAGQMVQGGRQAANLSPVEQLRRAVWELNLKKAEDILPVIERLSGEKADVAEGQAAAEVLPAFLSKLGEAKILEIVAKVDEMVEAGSEPAAQTVQATTGPEAGEAGDAEPRPDDPATAQTGWEDDPEPGDASGS